MCSPRPLLLAVAGLLLAACRGEAPPPPPAPPETPPTAACDDAGARGVVERLGEGMKRVPLLAADSVLVRTLRETYGPLVTPALLSAWTAAPSLAPGRDVSSPWPERIEVFSITPDPAGGCRVTGEVVYVTSAEPASDGAAARVPVVLRVVEGAEWRVASYETRPTGTDRPGTPADTVPPAEPDPAAEAAAPEPAPVDYPESTADPDSPEGAADVVRRYYAAIDARDYRAAYAMWGEGGAPNGQTYGAFVAGFAETARVTATVGPPGEMDAAMGSRYVEVPVTVRAVTTRGVVQRFGGTYTLRRTVVDGATQAQRRWHFTTASIARLP